MPATPGTEPYRRAFQIVKIGKELIGIYSADYTFLVYKTLPMTPDSPLEVGVRKTIEDMTKLEPGDCILQ
jgi:hypothetical protein